MKNGFTLHQDSDATAETTEVFEGAAAIFGFVPNLYRVLAEAPVVGNALSTLYPLVEKTSLTPIEQQVVYQAINVTNRCHYCVPAHTMVSRRVGMPEDVIEALRAGKALSDPKLEALRAFAEAMTLQRGDLSGPQLEALLEAGYSRQTAIEVVFLIAVKVITNYTNHLSGTPIDTPFEKEAWSPVGTSDACSI